MMVRSFWAHELRRTYALARYQELSGWPAPYAGGPNTEELPAEMAVIDQVVRMCISEELGVGCEEITAVYLGR